MSKIIFSLFSHLPYWIQAIIPKVFYITEKSWNYYPFTITGRYLLRTICTTNSRPSTNNRVTHNGVTSRKMLFLDWFAYFATYFTCIIIYSFYFLCSAGTTPPPPSALPLKMIRTPLNIITFFFFFFLSQFRKNFYTYQLWRVYFYVIKFIEFNLIRKLHIIHWEVGHHTRWVD